MPLAIRISCYNNSWQVGNCLNRLRRFAPAAFVSMHDDQSDREEYLRIAKYCAEFDVRLSRNSSRRGWTGTPASALLLPQMRDILDLAELSGCEKIVKMDSDSVVVGDIASVVDAFSGDLGGTMENGIVSCAAHRRLWGLPPIPDQHIQGGCYIVSCKIIQRILLVHTKSSILSKMNSHEDMMMSSAVYGCGGSVVDVQEIQSEWRQRLWKRRRAKPVVMHPIKNELELFSALTYLEKEHGTNP